MMAINPASCAAKQEHVQDKNRSRCAMRSACPSAQNNAMAVQQGRVARRREALAAVALGQGAAAASVATVIDAVSPSCKRSAAAAAPGKMLPLAIIFNKNFRGDDVYPDKLHVLFMLHWTQ